MPRKKKIPCYLCHIWMNPIGSLHCPLCHRNMCIECSNCIDTYYKDFNNRPWYSSLEKDIYRTTLEDIINARLEEENPLDTPREPIETLYAKEKYPGVYMDSICDQCLENKLLDTLKEYPMETAGLLINADYLQNAAKRRLRGE